MQGRNQNCGTCPVACIKTPSSSKNTAWIVYRRQPAVRLGRKNRYKRLVFILVLFSLVLLVGILGFGLTKEKEKKVQKTEQFVSSQKVVLVNGGCENMQTNPLKEETDEQMIKAVKDYFNSPSAQKFSFSTIATRQMKFRLYDYFRTQERRKRNMEVLSIHVGLYPDGAPLEDTIPAHDPIMQQLEMDLLLHELAGRVSKQQMDIVHLKQGGYGIREIARTQKVPMRRIKELLAEVHDVLLDICYG